MKMVSKKIWSLFLLSCVLLLGACNTDESTSSKSDDEKIIVVTTIAQIGEPLSVIGGDRVEVKTEKNTKECQKCQTTKAKTANTFLFTQIKLVR